MYRILVKVAAPLLSLFTVYFHAAAFAETQWAPFEAKYVAHAKGFEVGEAIMRLNRLDKGQFELHYESDVSLFFYSDRRAETSLFTYQDNQLQPLEYRYTREGTGSDKSLLLRFDRAANQIHKTIGDPINWQDEWDNQLYRFDLQSKIKANATDIRYKIINYRGQLREYGFEIVGEEVLDLPYGKLNTVKVKTIRANKKRETWSWFAPDLNYQLVRLKQFKKGKEQGDIQLSEYRLLD